MATPPVRTELADTYPAPSNATFRTGIGKFYDYVTVLLGASGSAADARTALGAAALAGSASQNFSVLALTASGGINESRGSVAMHATTMDLSGKQIFDGTGTAVTMTALADTLTVGARRVVYPIAGTIITNGATFAVDGAANQTAVAGDAWEFETVTITPWAGKVHITKKNGTAVANNGEFRSIQVFTASGTYTTPSGLVRAKITVVGGGGGGHNGSGSDGGGGGGGGSAILIATAATIGASQAVTVGLGGAVSTTGGTSSFGALVSATGGQGGGFGGGGSGSGGGGGGGNGGDLNINGGGGSNGVATLHVAGGSSVLGGGAVARFGASGGAYGGGGAGAPNGIGGAGVGAGGVVLVEEYF